MALVANSGWNLWNFRRRLIRELTEAGYQPLLIAPEDDYFPRLRQAFPEIPLIPLRHLSARGVNPWQDFRLLLEFRAIYRRYRPGLALHFTVKPNIYGGLAARWTGTACLATITGLGYAFMQKGWLQRIVSFLYRLALKKAKHVVFQNQDDAVFFHQKKIIHARQLQIIPGSGVDGEHFPLTPLPDFQPFRFLFVGRLLKDKGIREFVKAAQMVAGQVSQVEFWICGSEAVHNPSAISPHKLRKWKEHPALRWLGRVDDIREPLRQVHVLVLPSYREGMPRSVLEALAMGRPIITTDAPGCRDTVMPGQNGWVAPVKNVEALATAMLEAYGTIPEDLEKMGAFSRRMVEEKFEVKLINKAYLELIEE